MQGPVPEVSGMEVGRERQDYRGDVVKRRTRRRQDVRRRREDAGTKEGTPTEGGHRRTTRPQNPDVENGSAYKEDRVVVERGPGDAGGQTSRADGEGPSFKEDGSGPPDAAARMADRDGVADGRVAGSDLAGGGIDAKKGATGSEFMSFCGVHGLI